MAEYPNNSHSARERTDSTAPGKAEKKLEKVVTGAAKTRKKSEARKFVNIFVPEDGENAPGSPTGTTGGMTAESTDGPELPRALNMTTLYLRPAGTPSWCWISWNRPSPTTASRQWPTSTTWRASPAAITRPTAMAGRIFSRQRSSGPGKATPCSFRGRFRSTKRRPQPCMDI